MRTQTLWQYCAGWTEVALIAIGVNDGVACLPRGHRKAEPRTAIRAKIFPVLQLGCVEGGAHLFRSTRSPLPTRNRRICWRSAICREQQGFRSVESGSEVAMEMKFVLVNGRTPSPQSSCALCCEPIGEGYVRDVTTRLAYCDHRCYVGHRHTAAAALEQRARREQDRYAFARNDFYSADPESSFV